MACVTIGIKIRTEHHGKWKAIERASRPTTSARHGKATKQQQKNTNPNNFSTFKNTVK